MQLSRYVPLAGNSRNTATEMAVLQEKMAVLRFDKTVLRLSSESVCTGTDIQLAQATREPAFGCVDRLDPANLP
jgi:hypothetical protein